MAGAKSRTLGLCCHKTHTSFSPCILFTTDLTPESVMHEVKVAGLLAPRPAPAAESPFLLQAPLRAGSLHVNHWILCAPKLRICHLHNPERPVR